jgi:hypothetical protein
MSSESSSNAGYADIFFIDLKGEGKFHVLCFIPACDSKTQMQAHEKTGGRINFIGLSSAGDLQMIQTGWQ